MNRNGAVSARSDGTSTGTDLLRTQTLMQQHEHAEQDEVLEDMQSVLQRLNVMSRDIGNEISEQDTLIHEAQTEADYARDKMQRVDKMMSELMQKGGLTPCKTIVILFAIAVVLIV